MLQQRLTSTVRTHRPWKDAPHCAAPKLVVDRIERILNPRLQAKYVSELQDLAGLCERRTTPIDVDAIRVDSFEGLRLNEFLLFHGLPSDIAPRVLLQGLDPRYAGEHSGKLFGQGIYLASNSSKSVTSGQTQDACQPKKRHTHCGWL